MRDSIKNPDGWEDRLSDIERTTIIDLTKPLNASFIPYSRGNYSDPPLEVADWSTISIEGFHVSRLSLGTQTGTHIDAPAHFWDDGATLEALPSDHSIGSYFIIDLPAYASSPDVAKRMDSYRQEKILFLRTPENQTSQLSRQSMQKILSSPPVLWVVSGLIEIEHSAPLEFHRLVARAGKFLVEDLEQKAAHLAPDQGEIFVFPMRLVGTSGAPCRVMVRKCKA
jgi:arylformamidase